MPPALFFTALFHAVLAAVPAISLATASADGGLAFIMAAADAGFMRPPCFLPIASACFSASPDLASLAALSCLGLGLDVFQIGRVFFQGGLLLFERVDYIVIGVFLRFRAKLFRFEKGFFVF